jgi:hypothetical protein
VGGGKTATVSVDGVIMGVDVVAEAFVLVVGILEEYLELVIICEDEYVSL